MKYKGSGERLIELGYKLNYLKNYYYKVISIKGDYTSVFVDCYTREISFEGLDKFKKELINELGEVAN